MANAEQKTPPATLRDRVPLLSDLELASLNANAQRLKISGTNQQRAAATELLPVIEAELSDRRAKKLAAMPPKTPRVVKKKAPKAAAAAAKPVAAESAGE